MNAPAGIGAVVVAAEITAGHDGAAEMVVMVRHENGVTAPVVLDADTAFAMLRNCGAADVGALIGRSWREIVAHTPKEGRESPCTTS